MRASAGLCRPGRGEFGGQARSIMSLFRVTVLAFVAVAGSAGFGGAQVVTADSAAHVIVPLKRNGVIIENVFGNPRVAGAPYVLRIHNESNFVVLPHTHPEDENIVVLQGIWRLGSGPRFDRSKLKPMRVGDFTRIPRRMPHFAWSEGATIIQVHEIGPFRVDSVDPAFSLSQAKKD